MITSGCCGGRPTSAPSCRHCPAPRCPLRPSGVWRSPRGSDCSKRFWLPATAIISAVIPLESLRGLLNSPTHPPIKLTSTTLFPSHEHLPPMAGLRSLPPEPSNIPQTAYLQNRFARWAYNERAEGLPYTFSPPFFAVAPARAFNSPTIHLGVLELLPLEAPRLPLPCVSSL